MKLFLSVFVSLFAFTAIADTHSDDELAVLESLNAYYDARRNEDWKRVVSMESSAGVLSTNSDGSFHKPLIKQSADDWKNSGTGGALNIYYPEAVQLSQNVVFTRFYYEGMAGFGDVEQPYRTRVTMNWVKENGKWVVRSQHYSPANYGGVHVPQATDFDN